jgi:fermentation-respiration switch protein FrsA (DUF1100 family)
VRDARAALAYLKGRPDADPRGAGLFGISKGAGAALLAAARDDYLRCFVTDGVFGTYTVLVPYTRFWFRLYNDNHGRQALLPSWYYGLEGLIALRLTERERRCRFVHLERAMPRLAPRPLLMIHGEADTYIKADMARALFTRARPPREFWLVPGAKHNQALQIAGEEYRRRVLEFFERHLAPPEPTGQRSEDRGQRSEVKDQKSEERRQKSSLRGPKSALTSGWSVVRAVRAFLLTSDL